jgi:adenylate kinase
MLGAPASGKGTQSVELAKKLSIPHVSTGDLFRENISNQTELGKKAKSYIDQGKLVPDELVLDMLFDRVAKQDAKNGYILDGFPRTLVQAEALDKHLPKKATVIVLNLDVSDETITKRALGRKRSDDTLEVIQERLRNYHAQTAPLVEYYKK